jgi:hypothetical protein
VRLGFHLGPFYASTSTRRHRSGRSGCSTVIGWLFGIILLVCWPLWLKHAIGGWAWVIAGVWWGLLALALIAKLTETSGTKDGGGRSGHLASSERPSHPGPAEVRDQLIAITEGALGKEEKRNKAGAEQLASILGQLRWLPPSDAQLVRLAGLIPDTESLPPLVSAAGDRHSLRMDSVPALLDSLIASAEGKQSSHPGPAEVKDLLIAITEGAPGAEQFASVLRQLRELPPSDAQLVRLAGLVPNIDGIYRLIAAADDRHSLHTESARAMLDSLIASAEGAPSSPPATG